MLGNSLVVVKIEAAANDVMKPERTLYSGGNNSPTKTHCKGAAPKSIIFIDYSKNILLPAAKAHIKRVTNMIGRMVKASMCP